MAHCGKEMLNKSIIMGHVTELKLNIVERLFGSLDEV